MKIDFFFFLPSFLQSLVDDINVVCACLKDFLRNLKESLITYKLWPEFVKAVTGKFEKLDFKFDLCIFVF